MYPIHTMLNAVNISEPEYAMRALTDIIFRTYFVTRQESFEVSALQIVCSCQSVLCKKPPKSNQTILFYSLDAYVNN